MDRAACLAVEILVLSRLQEISRSMIMAAPAAEGVLSQREREEQRDVKRQKTMHTQPSCREQDAGINEFLMNNSHQSGRGLSFDGMPISMERGR